MGHGRLMDNKSKISRMNNMETLVAHKPTIVALVVKKIIHRVEECTEERRKTKQCQTINPCGNNLGE
jgi:hypothetical protein